MPVLDSYLFFNGNCAEAMRFYERTIGGKMEMMMTYADSPEPENCSDADKNRIMHACLIVDGRMLMASDTPSGDAAHGAKGMQGFALSLNYDKTEDARRVFDALAQGGSVTMPMGKTFWAEIFGMVTDRFGTPWMVGGGAQAG